MKYVLVMLTIFIVSCNGQTGVAQNTARKKYHYHHGLHHHGFYHYWIFLAVKAKIIFLIGTFISLWLFAGKAFAFLYYIQNNKANCKCPEYHHPEKIVISDEPHFDHRYSTILNSGPPINHRPSFYDNKPFVSTYERYSRSMEDSILPSMDVFKRIINKVDISEWAFSVMKLKKKSCKKRFVCEANQRSKNNPLFAFSFYLFSDVGLMKYWPNTTIHSTEDCHILGPKCIM